MGKRKGFTLIEVALFLAVTAALFLGIALGMQNSIFQQRYNDSVQSFLEYMRSIYSKVSNTQGARDIGDSGNSNYAIYGKLVVFGETKDLSGQVVEGQQIFMYDVIGSAEGISNAGSGNAKDVLKRLNPNVAILTKNADGNFNGAKIVSGEKYEPRWGARIEKRDGSAYTGSILVIKHPQSGTMNTLVSGTTIQVNEIMAGGNYNVINTMLMNNLDSFSPVTVDFCVNSDDGRGFERQNIRLMENARNGSQVEMIDLDPKWNPTTNANPNGNRC
ncbi:prepilin-type N-terminal cleavage/methylation domain-containing protein [Candidatus Saccharibacteria bacterium]|nr:prepilin-type N-terminal cleavage/methylation domain-containing protein [Candidatus Saccharibacteria bacterium]